MIKLDFLINYIGETLWSPCYGKVILDSVVGDKIVIISLSNHKKHTLSVDGGTHYVCKDGRCMLYGSEDYYLNFLDQPEESWKAWLKRKTEVVYKVTILVQKEVGGKEDSEPGSYSLEFSDVSKATKAAKKAREALDNYKSGAVLYKDFSDFPEDFKKLVILGADDFWIEVTNEGETFGVASFSPYFCHTEKHELTREEALSEIHTIFRKRNSIKTSE